MTYTVANVSNTSTFYYWKERTNELATAMSNLVVTVNSNAAIGNAQINGTFTANNLIISGNATLKAIIANNSLGTSGQVITTNGSAIYWSSLSQIGINQDLQYTWTNNHYFGANVSVGNSSVNVAVTSSGITLANSSLSFGIKLPTATQVNEQNWFLNANGEFAPITALTGSSVVANTITANNLTVVSNAAIRRIVANNSIGQSGQILASNGSGVYWSYFDSLNINLNAEYQWNNVHTFSNKIIVGGSGTNVVVTTANIVLTNSTASISIKVPSVAEIQSGNRYLNANGVWSVISVANSATYLNTSNDVTLKAYSDTKAANAYTNAVAYVATALANYTNTAAINTKFSYYTNTATLDANYPNNAALADFISSSELAANLANYTNTAVINGQFSYYTNTAVLTSSYTNTVILNSTFTNTATLASLYTNTTTLNATFALYTNTTTTNATFALYTNTTAVNTQFSYYTNTATLASLYTNTAVLTSTYTNTAVMNTQFSYYTNTAAATLAALTDVAIVGTPTTGYVLKWNGTKWAPAVDATSGGAGLDAATLNGQDGAYYLDATNHSNVAIVDIRALAASPLDFSGTTDNTTLIQNAINSVSAAEIYFPPGTLKVSNLVMKAGVSVRGAGVNKTYFIPAAGSIPVFKYNAATTVSDFNMSDMTITSGAFSGVTAVLIDGTDSVKRCNRIKLKNMYLSGTGLSKGIHLKYSFNITLADIDQSLVVDAFTLENCSIASLYNCTAMGGSGKGFNFIGGDVSAIDEGIKLFGCSTDGQALGMQMSAHDWGVMTACSFRNATTGTLVISNSSNWDIGSSEFYPSSAYPCANVDALSQFIGFNNCKFISGSYGVNNGGTLVTISGCRFKNNSNVDIFVTGTKSVVTGSTLLSTTFANSIVESGSANSNLYVGNILVSNVVTLGTNSVSVNNLKYT